MSLKDRIVREFISMLESGNYNQTKFFLGLPSADGKECYCVGGVFCEAAIFCGVTIRKSTKEYCGNLIYYYNDEAYGLPPRLRQIFGIEEMNNIYDLMWRNDIGVSFVELAQRARSLFNIARATKQV